MSMNPRTVGVAPGTYTLQLGAPFGNMPQASACPPDGWGTGAYGVPRVGWYDVPNNYYGFTADQILPPGQTPLTIPGWSPGPAPTTATPLQSQYLNPYGTQSKLQGITDSPPTVAGIRLDILATVLGVAAALAFGVGYIANR
jgi:hypothetical protein